MSNPNTVTVYSPDGEPFEMSRVNARDLVAHRKWSMSPMTAVETVLVQAEATSETVVAPEIITQAVVADGEEEQVNFDDDKIDEESDVGIFTTEEQFDGLTEREDVVAYLAKHFPDFVPHHKSSRDGLVAKAIKLATGE